MQKTKLIKDIIGWDTVNWGRGLQYLESHLPEGDSGSLTALELGSGDNGGLSLWLALKGIKTTCSGYHPKHKTGVYEQVKKIHKYHKVDNLIDYQEIDARDIPYESLYDIVCYKSVLGGIVRESGLDVAQEIIDQIYKSLKPGGRIIFMENISSTRLHKILRDRYGAGKNQWRYFTINEFKGLHRRFIRFDYQTYGFLGCFGRTETQRVILGKVDGILCRSFVPKQYRYILAGVAVK